MARLSAHSQSVLAGIGGHTEEREEHMAAKHRGPPGAGAGRRRETNLPHITWPQLLERYPEAKTFEERLGLIHATRRAATSAQAQQGHNPIEEAHQLLERIRFLTMIGNEVGVGEQDPELRWQARTTLSRYCLPNVLREPIKLDHRVDQCGAEITRALRTCAVVLTEFFAASESHMSGTDNDCRKDIRAFLAARWMGCPQPDDEDDSSRGAHIPSRQEKGLIAPITILQALVHAEHYEFLADACVWDAAPHLYRKLWEHGKINWFPAGLSTREIFEGLRRSEAGRRLFAENRDAILDACGSRIDGTTTEASIVRALLELLARLHHKLAELGRESSSTSRLPFPRTPADATSG